MPSIPLHFYPLHRDTFADKIRRNNDIKGITVCGNEIKISQYADKWVTDKVKALGVWISSDTAVSIHEGKLQRKTSKG